MTNDVKSVASYHLVNAKHLVEVAVRRIDDAIRYTESEKSKRHQYQTPQWHHTILWTGFAFIVGMLLGGGLASI
ncbi:MAG: hypothetical protein MRK00_16390 [Nitrosomonas sp.]|nr:hypothetical protein [Nitrosomonas sp.]